jgi:hypothetical protein
MTPIPPIAERVEALSTSKQPMLTVAEISKHWKRSRDSVRRIFAEEPGVLKFGHATQRVGRKYRRAYFTLRIPAEVFQRVEDRLRRKA